MNDTDQKKILRRVAKMLALANDAGATEGERDNALRAAHATLAKYNLDFVQVEEATQKENADEPRMEHKATLNGFPWARIVSQASAKLFFCSFLVHRARGQHLSKMTHAFIGRQSNAITASLMAEYLIKSIQREAKQRATEGFHDASWVRDFTLAAAIRLSERVKELRTEAEQQKGTGTDIVLASLYQTEAKANDEYINRAYPVLESRGSKLQGWKHPDAYHKGRAFGGSVSLNHQVK